MDTITPTERAYRLNTVLNDWASGRFCAREHYTAGPWPSSAIADAKAEHDEDVVYHDMRWGVCPCEYCRAAQ